MNRRALRLLHLRELRRRPGRTALAVTAVGAGVALVVGVAISIGSLNHSFASFTDRIGGPATLRVEGAVDHGGLDATVLPRIADLHGVQAAIPMVFTITQAVDRRGHVLLVPALGIDCSIQAAVGQLGCTPDLLASLGEGPAIGPALHDRAGSTGAIRTDLGSTSLRAAPVVPALRHLNGGLVAIYGLRAAQRQFARPNGLDAIYVIPRPGIDPERLRADVAAAAGTNNKVVDATTPMLTSAVAGIVLPFLLLISVIGLLIGVQLARNALELSLEERRRELATSAALGATPRNLVTGVLAEATAIGAAGGIVGLGLGTLVARAFVGSLSSEVERATGLRVPITVAPVALVLGEVVGITVCVLASILPARRTARRDLTAELSERGRYAPSPAARRPRLWLTATGLAAALALAWPAHRNGAIEAWQPPLLWGSMVLATLLAFRLPAQLARPVLGRLQGRGRFGSGPARVALDNLLSTPKRTASLAAAIGAPVVVAVMIGSIVPSIHVGARRVSSQSSSGQVYVSTLGAINTSGIDAKTPPDLERRVAAVPGVASVGHWYYAIVSHPDTHVSEVDGVDGPVPRFTVYSGVDGPTAIRRGQVMIGPALARDEHLREGSSLTIPGRYGPVHLTVGGIWANTNGIGRGVLTTAAVMRSISGDRPPDRLSVVPKPGVSPAELARRIRAAHLDPRLIVLDPDHLATYFSDEFAAIASPFWAMQRGILLVALISTASTLLLAAIQRRRELAVLAALGMSPADLARSTLIETLLLGSTAALIAAVGSQAALVIFTWASGLMTSLVIPYTAQPVGTLVAGLSVVAIALLGAALPAWRANRADPVLALREE